MNKRVGSLLVLLICFTGFIIHSRPLFFEYFSYKTFKGLQPVLAEEEVLAPNCSFCIRYVDIVDRREAKKYGINPRRQYSANFSLDQSVLTVRQIFDLTPPEETFIKKCYYRDPETTEAKIYETDDCRKFFYVKKFYTQEFICYSFGLKNITSYQISTLAHSIRSSRTIYSVHLAKEINKADYVYFIIHYGLMPLTSRNFGIPTTRLINYDMVIPRTNIYRVIFASTHFRHLPPPYDTMCTYDDEVEQKWCYHECLISKMAEYNRVPFSELIFDPVDMKHEHPYREEDQHLKDDFLVLRKKCSDKCQQKPCIDDYSRTAVCESLDIRSNVIRMNIMTEQAPQSLIVTLPKVRFVDFFTYICSSFSLWFGVSILGLNPFNVRWRRLERRYRKFAKSFRNGDR